jgi:DNA-binding beta-propeller fold protein YncE
VKRFPGCCAAILLVVVPVHTDNLVLVAGGDRADLASPFGVAFDSSGNLYFVEMKANRVGRIDADQRVSIAGSGTKGSVGDGGSALRAEFDGPHSLAVGMDGVIYVADTWNNRVRKIDPKSGIITNFAGGEKGFGGDGGPAAKAKFGGVYCIAFDPAGKTIYLADLDNRRIRAIDMKTGIVTTIAGNGTKGVPTDGAKATEAPLLDPRAVAADDKGNIWILERGADMLCASSMPPARSAPWLAPAKKDLPATEAKL